MTRGLKSCAAGVAVFIAFSLFCPSAWADEFMSPSLSNIAKTLVRFGALDIRKDESVDAYGQVVECDIYKRHFENDFQWQKVRAALRKSIKQNVASFPTGYKYDAVLQLDRYDFKAGLFPFTAKTAQSRTNVFTISSKPEDFCIRVRREFILPRYYRFILDDPIRIMGLSIGPEEGKLLLKRMDESGNSDRMVYTRFNLVVTYVAPLAQNKENAKRRGDLQNFGPMVNQDSGDGFVDLNTRLDSIEYFEDPERTRVIYTYRP